VRNVRHINLLESEWSKLKDVICKQTSAQHIAKQARIILMANGDGTTNQEIAGRLGIDKPVVITWT